MRIEKLGPWLRPALLAPWLTMTACVTVGIPLLFVFGLPEPLFGGLISHWVIVMVAGSFATGLISSVLIAVDSVHAALGTPAQELTLRLLKRTSREVGKML